MPNNDPKTSIKRVRFLSGIEQEVELVGPVYSELGEALSVARKMGYSSGNIVKINNRGNNGAIELISVYSSKVSDLRVISFNMGRYRSMLYGIERCKKKH